MPRGPGGPRSGVGRRLPFGDIAARGPVPASPGAEGRGGGRPAGGARQDRGGTGPGLAGRPAWPLSADRSRHLSISGTSFGTSPTGRTSPGGDRGADRSAAPGSTRVIGRITENRLVPVRGLPDGGGGSRPRGLRSPGVAGNEGRGVRGLPHRNRAGCLPAGEVGQRHVFPHGDQSAPSRRRPRSGDLPAPHRVDGRPACRSDTGPGRPGMGSASSTLHPGCAGAAHRPAGPRRRTITVRPGNSPASAGG